LTRKASHKAACEGRVSGGARRTHRADKAVRRHGVGDQRASHGEVRRPDQARDHGDDKDVHGTQRTGEGKQHHRQRQYRIDGAHRAEHDAMTDPVTRHAEHRRDQRAKILQRTEQREQQHRAGLGQDVPAEDQVLHLAAPRGEQVGWILEAEAANLKRCKQRGRCHRAHGGACCMAWWGLSLLSWTARQAKWSNKLS
jgi:hypothetical protein